MRLWNVVGAEHGIGPSVHVYGVSIGSYGPQQSCFIVPIKGLEREVDEARWGVLPSLSLKPMLVANSDLTAGVILFLSSYNRVGKKLGRVFAVDDGQTISTLTSVGYGFGGTPDGSVTWEEVLLSIRGKARLYLVRVGPPDLIVEIDGEEVTTEDVIPYEVDKQIGGELVRIDDPRIARWNHRYPHLPPEYEWHHRK